MGRKFRLSVHRKNEDRRREPVVSYHHHDRPFTVSISLDKLPFRVSWPLQVYTHSVAGSLSSLHQRIMHDGNLPEGLCLR